MSRNVFDNPGSANLYAMGRMGDLIVDNQMHPRLAIIHAHLESISGTFNSILDIACATANFQQNLAQWNFDAHYTGADYSSEMLARARAKNPDIPLVQAMLPRLPFADKSFDCVVSGSTLNFVPEFEESLTELFRVSRRYIIFELFCSGAEDCLQTIYYSASGESVPIRLPGKDTVMNMIVDTSQRFPLAKNPKYVIWQSKAQQAGFKDIVPLGHTLLNHYFFLCEKYRAPNR